MEIDILSPQMRIRSVSNKRSRSPGSPSPLERAPKRPMMVPRESILQLSCNTGAPKGLGAGARRSLYEDEWVHQTRGMTIHSPALYNGEQTSGPESKSPTEGARVDVQMSGPEESFRPDFAPQTFHPKLPTPSVTTQLPDIETSRMTLATSHSHFRSPRVSQPPSLDLSASDAASSSAQACLQTQPHSAPPNILLHPATPSTPSEGPRTAYVLTSSRPCTPPTYGETPSSPMSIVIENCPSSPTTHWRNGGHKRRPFVSMGPRADCEKCRLKVPGHWMHFD